MPRHHAATRNFLRRLLATNAGRTADVRRVITQGPRGFTHEEVILERDCQETILHGTANQGVVARPGTTVQAFHPLGGAAGSVQASSPPGSAGTAVAQGDELVFDITPPEYRALVVDPDNSSLVHVHRYSIVGAYLGELTVIDFSPQTDPTPTLESAVPIKGIEGTPDGFAILGNTGGNHFLMLVNLESGIITQTQMTGGTGPVRNGMLQVDPAGPYIYSGGVLDIGPSPDEVRLFRTTLPGLTGTVEVGAFDKTGVGAVRQVGVYAPDRWRVGQQTGGVWTTIDSILLDPAASPQVVSETADLHDNPDGFLQPRIWPLGHNGVDTGWFAWDDSEGIKIWKIGLTGAGVEAGFTDGQYQNDFFKAVVSGPVDDRWWTLSGMFEPPDQGFGEALVARIQFAGAGISLPTPTALDIAAAEDDQGWSAGEALPGAVLPDFP